MRLSRILNTTDSYTEAASLLRYHRALGREVTLTGATDRLFAVRQVAECERAYLLWRERFLAMKVRS